MRHIKQILGPAGMAVLWIVGVAAAAAAVIGVGVFLHYLWEYALLTLILIVLGGGLLFMVFMTVYEDQKKKFERD